MLTPSAAAEEDELALEPELELTFVLKVVPAADEVAFNELETLLEAEAAALELAFWLGLEATLEADLTWEEDGALELALTLDDGVTLGATEAALETALTFADGAALETETLETALLT